MSDFPQCPDCSRPVAVRGDVAVCNACDQYINTEDLLPTEEA